MKCFTLLSMASGISLFITYNTFALADVTTTLANIGDDVRLFWKMDPKPTYRNQVWIGKRPKFDLLYLEGEDSLVSQKYRERVVLYGHLDGNINFTLKNIQISDAGIYAADTKSDNGINLIIMERPVIHSTSVPIVDENITLTCSSNLDSLLLMQSITLKFKWNVRVALEADNKRFFYDRSILSIRPVTLKDMNTYITCVGYDDEGFQSEESYLFHVDPNHRPRNVLLSPYSLRYHLMIDEDVPLINCSASCKPDCAYQWIKDNTSFVSDGELLLLTTVNISDAGKYFCVANNSIGFAMSEIIDINISNAVINTFQKEALGWVRLLAISSSTCVGGIIIMILACCLMYFVQKRRRRVINRIKLEDIRKRLALAENRSLERLPSGNHDYIYISDVDDIISEREQQPQNLQYQSDESYEVELNEAGSSQGSSPGSSQGSSPDSSPVESVNSYQDLAATTKPEGYVAMNDAINIEPPPETSTYFDTQDNASVMLSDIDSNMADDEKSSSYCGRSERVESEAWVSKGTEVTIYYNGTDNENHCGPINKSKDLLKYAKKQKRQ